MQLKDIHAKDIKRFWSKVDKKGDNDCWTWHKAVNNKGYGTMTIKDKRAGAHRFSYMIHYGDIQNDLWVLHKCDNPRCQNPKHLFVGTRSDNVRDMMSKGRDRIIGSKNAMAKFKESDVIRFLDDYDNDLTIREISQQYQIRLGTMQSIIIGPGWPHLKKHRIKRRDDRFNKKTPRRKLNKNIVLKIRKEYQTGLSVSDISLKYDIHYSSIYRIIQYQTWTGKIIRNDLKAHKGELNPKAKLNSNDVLNIREKAKKGILVQELSRHYNVTTATIYNLINRKTWQHI